jgi:hypothetical protein
MSGASVKVEPVEGSETMRGKGPWMRDVEKKLSEAIEIGVRSSGKASTRQYRVRFYTERLMKAKLEVAFFEHLLELEEDMETLPGRYGECRKLEEELRALDLKDRVEEMRDRVGVSGDEVDVDSEGASTVRTEKTEVEEWDTTL